MHDASPRGKRARQLLEVAGMQWWRMCKSSSGTSVSCSFGAVHWLCGGIPSLQRIDMGAVFNDVALASGRTTAGRKGSIRVLDWLAVYHGRRQTARGEWESGVEGRRGRKENVADEDGAGSGVAIFGIASICTAHTNFGFTVGRYN